MSAHARRRAVLGVVGTAAVLVLGLSGCAEVSAPATQECASSEDCAAGVCQDGACVEPEDADMAVDATGDPARDPDLDSAREVVPLSDANDAPACGDFPEPCTRNQDCCSGYCIDTDDGRVCTNLCVDDRHCTGEGWECRVLAGSEPDVVRLCVPPRDVLCEPCTNDTQCGGLNDLCLDQDNGSYCATDCSSTRVCPEGYVCNRLTLPGEGPDGGDLETFQCEPELGFCGDAPLSCDAGTGDCDDSRANGCETDLTDPATCGTTCANRESCDDDDACTEDLCVSGSCHNPTFCEGSATSCGCGSCADCTLRDGWVDVGEPYACCDEGSACTTCQDQEYRTFTCTGTECTYEVTDTQTLHSECTACSDDDLCSDDLCVDGACVNPATCEGTDTSCGCASCADCTASDGWVEVGTSYACCDGSFRCACQDRELRAWSCDGTECTYEVTDTDTTRTECTACSDGDACTQDECTGSGVCSFPATCAGTAASCGCTSCTDCTANDGWYNLGAPYACCDGTSSCSSCQDQEYRTHTCNGTGCGYSVTGTQTVRTGCAACDDANACTDNLCTGAGVCAYPAHCAGTTESCGCTTCNDCSVNDGWYDIGASYACCSGSSSCSTCQDQEYRTYSCSGTGCTYTVVANNTETTGCSACNDGNSCTQNVCSGAGVCSYPATCAGTSTSCGCSSCSNCSASNGWYNVGAPYACCNGSSACSSCQNQEYRTYACSGTSCTYGVTSSQTLRTGCSSCNDFNSCTQNLCSGGSCSYPGICGGTNTSCGCSICSDCTSLPHTSTTSCSSQTCAINSCASGYANCDTSLTNGCERQNSGTSNSAPGEYLGSYAGDRTDNWPICGDASCTLRQTRSGTQGRWFYATATESSDCCAYVAMTFELDVPADADFDLAVTGACQCVWWTGTGWASGCTSLRGTGAQERLVAWCADDCLGDDSGFTANVQVQYYSGSTCGSWVLRTYSRDCYP